MTPPTANPTIGSTGAGVPGFVPRAEHRTRDVAAVS
jgi:hypothetical protein